MNVLVQTQSLEDYGVDLESWKFKGSSVILVCGVSKEANAVALVALACQRSSKWLEVPRSWEALDEESYGPHMPDWENWKRENFIDEVWDSSGEPL